MSEREEILIDATKCVCGDRDQEYGGPEDSFGIIAKFWSIYLGIDICASDIGVMMALHKIARIKTSNKKSRDSFVDAAGYSACAYECAMAEQNYKGDM